jgi:hypothetical protein
VLVDSRAKLRQARAWLEAATLIDGCGGGGATRISRAVIGLDCEWQPGKSLGKTPNPVAVVQLAAGVAEAHEGGCRAVLLDCLALLGPAADDATAAATSELLAWVFSNAVVVGFGVAGDVKRLLTSYPERLAPVAVAAAELAAAQDKQAAAPASAGSSHGGVRTVCVRDVALSRGVDAVDATSLASLCRALLDGRGGVYAVRTHSKSACKAPGVDPTISPPTFKAYHRSYSKWNTVTRFPCFKPFYLILEIQQIVSLRCELDKSQQKSEWGARPLTVAQVRYAALDALVPAMILRRLLATHPLAAVLNKEGGQKKTDRLTLNIAAAAQPWTRVERFAGSLGAFASSGGGGGAGSSGGSGGGGLAIPGGIQPRTADDVRMALEAAAEGRVLGPAGLRLEEWEVRYPSGGSGEGGEAVAVVPSGVILCKTLGVIASGSGGTQLVVCVLEVRDRLKLDMDAVARLLRADEQGGGNVSAQPPNHLSTMKCRLATPEELVAEFGFPRGCMGPVGLRHPRARYRVLMDEALLHDGGGGADVDHAAVDVVYSTTSGGGGGGGGEMDKSWRLIAVGGGAPRMKVVGRAGALAVGLSTS